MKQLGTWPGIPPQQPYSTTRGETPYPEKPPPQCGLQVHKATVITFDLHALRDRRQPPPIVNIVKLQALGRTDPAVAHAGTPAKWIREGSEVGLARAQPFTDFSEEPASRPREPPGDQQPANTTILTMTVSPPDRGPSPSG